MKSDKGTYISVKIDGKRILVPEGSTVLDAAVSAGIYIPTLCYLKDLKSYGGCRLCIVEIKNMKGYPTACTTPVTNEMEISTKSPELQSIRREILELILSEHPYSCLICNDKKECQDFMHTIRKVTVTTGCNFCTNNGDCELQDLVEYLELKEIRFPITYRNVQAIKDNPFYDLDYNLCILCGRCVRICNEERYSGVLAFVQRGNSTLVGTTFGESQIEAGCEYCGACVDVCPTGSLSEKIGSWVGVPTNSTTSTCILCSVGCRMNINTKGNRIVNIGPRSGKKTEPDQLCIRGKFIPADITHHPERITKPLINKNGVWLEITWNQAIDFITEHFKKFTGNDFGIIGSAHDTIENSYALQKFCRVVMGSNNIDLSPTYNDQSLFKKVHGFQPVGIDEIIGFDAIFIIGSNASVSHPIIENRIRKAYHHGAKIITAHSHINRTYQFSNERIIYHPGSENIFLLQILNNLKTSQNIKFPKDISDVLKLIDTKHAATLTGIRQAQIRKIIKSLAPAKKILIIAGDTMFKSSLSNDNFNLLSNIYFALNNFADCGMMFLVDDGNRFGATYTGMHPEYLPGFLEVRNGAKKWSEAWGIDIPPVSGLSAEEMISNLPGNNFKSLFLKGDLPDHEKLDKLEFFVQQNMFITETSKYADILLPAYCFTESNGHIINIERKLKQINPAVQAPESIKPTWQILSNISQKLKNKSFQYRKTNEIYEEITAKLDLSIDKTTRKTSKPELSMPDIKIPLKKRKIEMIPEPDYFLYQGNSMSKLIPDMKQLIDKKGGKHG